MVRWVYELRRVYRRWLYRRQVIKSLHGVRPRECTLCGFRGMFRGVGHPPRYDALCRRCGSAERHRLLALAFQRLDLVSAGEKLIHFAPEARVTAYLKEIGVDHLSADIMAGRADIQLDLHAIARDDESVDTVLLIHVLEHVDDRLALSEIFRILRPGGRMIAMVPISEGWAQTYENPSITRPEDRAEHFGQWDHVRWYGRDFRDRVKAAGLILSEFTATGDECARYSLGRGEVVFVGRKP